MNRQIYVNSHVRRRRSGFRGRRLSYSPRIDAPAPTPRIDAPAPTPRIDAPAPTPRIDAPAPTPRIDAPAPTPRIDAPTPAPRSSILSRRAAEEYVQAWHTIGDTNEPVTLHFVHNNADYLVHGNAPFSTRDFEEDNDVHNNVGERAHHRAVQLHERLQQTEQTEAPSPNYSPVHTPVMHDLESPRQVWQDSSDDESEYGFPHYSSSDESEDGVAPPQVDMAVFCHICSCTFQDTKNYNSSFVTTLDCNHAVCFKCYINIIFKKRLYKCSMCNLATRVCRVYNHRGYVELMSTRSVCDKQAIKTHWAQLLDSNMSDNNVSDDTIEQNYVQALQSELAELRASTARAKEHLEEVIYTKNAELLEERDNRLKAQLRVDQLEEQVDELQDQTHTLRAKNFSIIASVEEFSDQFNEFSRQQTDRLDEFSRQQTDRLDEFSRQQRDRLDEFSGQQMNLLNNFRASIDD
ncbi:IE-2 [Choristoneura rosaceana nucleopolyhedrovirus]|uniref:IE-2 n=1 Tax=Choristoneura rosaceana nucleopolyhedrovirus TaxID=58094 RepID=S5MQZ0_9ABAC|nr:IE-2 [Choristoneura rosaceana nucleopolyhedrovirus]AGR57043.1 IE-2 [Choristoneura rosaceana nucleopolyhedrovirus]